MAPSSSLLIIGAGGHGRVVADAALAQGCWTELRATDRDDRHHDTQLLQGIQIVPMPEATATPCAVHVAIGLAAFREAEAKKLALPLATVAHPRATASPYARIGDGSFLGASSVLAPGSRLGTCVIVNHGAVIDHDAQVGDFSHVGALVSVGGFARIGDRVLLGAGAKVLSRVEVGNDVTVEPGAVVSDDILEPGVYAGIPARRVR
jgi:sugar O-acyltransferase (sialic acid O-acetyltransferase NeuD family)